MANYTIHIAIAKEYLKRHKGYNEEEFIKGTIYPDMVQDKRQTHFGKNSESCNLKEFLSKYSIKDSYNAGWLLHLIVDTEFYHSYFNDWDSNPNNNIELLYQDYDIINSELIEKYNIVLPEDIKHICKFKKGELTYIKRETLFKFIEEISKKSIEEYIK